MMQGEIEMEFIAPKLVKSRTQKRQKRLIKNRRRNQRKKLEVKSSRRRKTLRDNNLHVLKQNENHCSMSANAFWENYKVAHDWQHRHNVAWWKSRCIALEDENRELRAKVRELVATTGDSNQMRNNPTENFGNQYYNEEREEEEGEQEELECEETAGENMDLHDDALEFQVDEGMMKFLEQSIRHKMELKHMRECENKKLTDAQENESKIKNQQSVVNSRIENCKALYGIASSRILAMETALQASIDHHKDRAKPHYWPNIPLKP